MKMESTVSSETSAIRNQTPGNYPKRNKLHLEHGESLKIRIKLLMITKINKLADLAEFQIGVGTKLLYILYEQGSVSSYLLQGRIRTGKVMS